MAVDFSKPVRDVRQLFAERGDSGYGGEAVSQKEHALQSAYLATQSGAEPGLIAAALLHDIGHLLHHLPDHAPDDGVDDHHEGLAARWLTLWFGPDVVEPVRLHVAAKRYLCAIEPSYFETLSHPSVVSLQLQGGPMSVEEVEQFERLPFYRDAVALRRWDDLAKDPEADVPGIEVYMPILETARSSKVGMPGIAQ